MWILLTLFILAFIAGGIFILLRTAKIPKIPIGLKSQPYEEDDD